MKETVVECAIPEWHLSPTAPGLEADEVHVWRVQLNQGLAQIHTLLPTLATEERERAERYKFQQHRQKFIVARGFLRKILGSYLDMEPGHVSFCYNAYGKPALDPTSGLDILHFNLSRSHDLALVAVTLGREIGIDLEYVRPNFANEQIAEHFFSSQEVATLRSLPKKLQERAFFTCWTRKEAYVKGTGLGLSLPLDKFDVSIIPGEPARLLRTTWDPLEASRWFLLDLDPRPGYVGALAVTGTRIETSPVPVVMRFSFESERSKPR